MDTTLYIEDSTLTELNEIPDYIENLTIINTPLTSLPKLPKKLGNLFIFDVPITELPKLPKSLKNLNIRRTKITKLPKLPTYLPYVEVPHNRITEFPKIGNYLKYLNLFDNRIENFPSSFEKFKNLKSLRIENNPGSLQYYKIDKLNKNNISFVNEIPVLTLKKGMVLFHNMNDIKKIYNMYLGFKVADSYVMNPNTQIYFMPHPFHTVSYGNVTTICVLQNDVKVVLGINPSKLVKEDIENFHDEPNKKDYFAGKNCNEELSLLKSFYGCPSEDIIKNNIMGWITHDANGGPNAEPGEWHSESKYFMKYYKYVSYYKNHYNILDRPEIMIHPYKRRLTEDVITPETEVFEASEASLLGDKTWLDKNEHKFNYKIIEIIDDNQKFKEYKDIIDSFLSKKGHNGYHMFRNEKDGFYMIREFM